MTRMTATRRTLLKSASALASLLLAPVSFLKGQTATPSPTPTPGPSGQEGPKGLAAFARERYGKYLDPDELKMLDEEMASLERRSGRLRAILLGNAEEPATDFTTLRGEPCGSAAKGALWRGTLRSPRPPGR